MRDATCQQVSAMFCCRGHSNGILVRNRAAQSIPKHGACRAMGSTWTPVLDVPLVITGDRQNSVHYPGSLDSPRALSLRLPGLKQGFQQPGLELPPQAHAGAHGRALHGGSGP